MCDARWRGGLLDFGWAGRVGRGERRLIEDADRVRVSTQAGGGALSVARQLACCGAALRRQVAAYGSRRRCFVCCLLLLCPYVHVHVHVHVLAMSEGRDGCGCSATRQLQDKLQRPILGAQVFCRRRPSSCPPVSPPGVVARWLRDCAIGAGPWARAFLPFCSNVAAWAACPHVHMPTTPTASQLDLKCRPCPPARCRPLIHHLSFHSIDYCLL
jgi:hypothetical protein